MSFESSASYDDYLNIKLSLDLLFAMIALYIYVRMYRYKRLVTNGNSQNDADDEKQVLFHWPIDSQDTRIMLQFYK
mgnify:CR=1 FL=1